MYRFLSMVILLFLTIGCDTSNPISLRTSPSQSNPSSLVKSDNKSQPLGPTAPVVKSKQEIEADKETLKELMKRLEAGNADEVYEIERKLDEFGETAIPFVINGLASQHAHVREACSTSLYFFAQDQSAKHYVSKAIGPLLAAASIEGDEKVLSIMAQAISMLKPDHSLAMPALLEMLEHGSSYSKRVVVDAIANYGPYASIARRSLHDAYRNANDDSEPETTPRLRTAIHFALIKIGSNEEDAVLITSTKLMTSREKATAVKVLLNHPAYAVDYLQEKPTIMATSADWFESELLDIFKSKTSETDVLRQYLKSRKDLPSLVRVRIGTAEQLDALRIRLAELENDPHQQSFVRACIRAIQESPDKQAIVEISESQEGNFRPTSAHPNTEKLRMSKNMRGHGDGITRVLITGSLKLLDGSPAVNPRFYAVKRSYVARDKNTNGKLRYLSTMSRLADSHTIRVFSRPTT